jgi:NagD protein
MEQVLDKIKSKTGFIIDMDGVIYHGNKLLPGVDEFLAWLENSGKKYLMPANGHQKSFMRS